MPRPRPSRASWSCPVCTFICLPSATECEICSTRRPTRGALEEAESRARDMQAAQAAKLLAEKHSLDAAASAPASLDVSEQVEEASSKPNPSIVENDGLTNSTANRASKSNVQNTPKPPKASSKASSKDAATTQSTNEELIEAPTNSVSENPNVNSSITSAKPDDVTKESVNDQVSEETSRSNTAKSKTAKPSKVKARKNTEIKGELPTALTENERVRTSDMPGISENTSEKNATQHPLLLNPTAHVVGIAAQDNVVEESVEQVVTEFSLEEKESEVEPEVKEQTALSPTQMPLPPFFWECSRCTFRNEHMEAECTMCNVAIASAERRDRKKQWTAHQAKLKAQKNVSLKGNSATLTVADASKETKKAKLKVKADSNSVVDLNQGGTVQEVTEIESNIPTKEVKVKAKAKVVLPALKKDVEQMALAFETPVVRPQSALEEHTQDVGDSSVHSNIVEGEGLEQTVSADLSITSVLSSSSSPDEKKIDQSPLSERKQREDGSLKGKSAKEGVKLVIKDNERMNDTVEPTMPISVTKRPHSEISDVESVANEAKRQHTEVSQNPSLSLPRGSVDANSIPLPLTLTATTASRPKAKPKFQWICHQCSHKCPKTRVKCPSCFSSYYDRPLSPPSSPMKSSSTNETSHSSPFSALENKDKMADSTKETNKDSGSVLSPSTESTTAKISQILESETKDMPSSFSSHDLASESENVPTELPQQITADETGNVGNEGNNNDNSNNNHTNDITSEEIGLQGPTPTPPGDDLSERVVCHVSGITAQEYLAFQDIIRAKELGDDAVTLLSLGEDHSTPASHVILSELKYTLKVLFGLARGAHVVHKNWLSDSLEHMVWQDETKYEFEEIAPSSALKREAIERGASPHLFMGKRFVVDDCVFANGLSCHTIVDLIKAAGGEVVPTTTLIREAADRLTESLRPDQESWQDITSVDAWNIDYVVSESVEGATVLMTRMRQALVMLLRHPNPLINPLLSLSETKPDSIELSPATLSAIDQPVFYVNEKWIYGSIIYYKVEQVNLYA